MINMDISKYKKDLEKAFIKLWDKIKGCDRSNLISIITGGIFALLCLIQIISVISTPLARNFDHVSLILVDFIIAAVCFVYVIYRRGGLSMFAGESEVSEEKTDTENDSAISGTKHMTVSGVSRVCIPSSSMQSKASGARSSQDAAAAENENLFSPRHRYAHPASAPANPPARSKEPNSTATAQTAELCHQVFIYEV